MHFFRDCGVTDFLLLQNRHTVHPVHNLRARILMYFMYTAVLRAMLPCTHKKITIFGGTLNSLLASSGVTALSSNSFSLLSSIKMKDGATMLSSWFLPTKSAKMPAIFKMTNINGLFPTF
jgi:hypothetical protein